MTLNELQNMILSSSLEDWNLISCWGAFSGPSYKNRFEFYNAFQGNENILHSESHSDVAACKIDLSVTMAYGLQANDDFNAEWANQFPDSRAHSDFVDVFYNNALVFRETYVVVDGGRCRLPIPSYSEDGLVVNRKYYDFIKLLNSFSSGSDANYTFDSYFKRTGIKIIDGEWI